MSQSEPKLALPHLQKAVTINPEDEVALVPAVASSESSGNDCPATKGAVRMSTGLHEKRYNNRA